MRKQVLFLKSLLLVLVFWAVSAFAQEVEWTKGVYFSGAPSYVSEFQTRFRDNGGPLSPFGSHFGIKAGVESREFASVRHYACATGVHILDYSRTGLVGISSVRFIKDGKLIKDAKERHIHFEYFGWKEQADFDDFSAQAFALFLARDQYLIGVKLKNISPKTLYLVPIFYFQKEAQKVSQKMLGKFLVLKFRVQPTFAGGKNFLAIIPSLPKFKVEKGERAGYFQLRGEELKLAPSEQKEFWFVFGYSPDSPEQAQKLAKQALRNFTSIDQAWKNMLAFREEFFRSLPTPHLSASEKDFYELYFMSATALENALYAPRGKMKYWACVPTKVHYNWFWLWDSGFQAIGYSEFAPERARDVILTIFQSQRSDGFVAHMADERAKPLTPHSQPPVFGYAGMKMISRYPLEPASREFEKELYEKSKLFIRWWKRARDQNRNGLFEYLSQDEGGWDNSPRANYVPKLIFIPYWGYLGEVLGYQFKPLDNVDLNSWMYFYYLAMSRWAEDLGKRDEAEYWKKEAKSLALRIDQILWDKDCACWLDTYSWIGSKKYHHFKVLTPAIWFPAFAGATLDERKARAVIEKHLLNPKEFFGKYPIPVVAYNDPYFNPDIPGWMGSIWLFSAYSALETLFKYGYEKEAQELRRRLLEMMADQNGMKGIYETYDPRTGKYKNKHSDGGYCSFQFGWSSAFTMEMILERYQEERFIFPQTYKIKGFIREARDFSSRNVFYKIDAGLNLPRVNLKSIDGNSLLEAKSIQLILSDPYNTLTRRKFNVQIKDKNFQIELDKTYIFNLD